VRLPALHLDLDGTLTDPRVGIVRCIQHALGRLARPCPPEDVLAACIGPPLRRTFARLLRTSEPDAIERAMALYRQRFAEVGLFENTVYDGIEPALDDLGRRGHVMFVATSKPAVFAERIVRHFGLARYLAGVYGPSLDGRFDDKAELLAHLLRAERLDRRGALMIGDRGTDVSAARANAVCSVGVLWGYGSRDELLAAGADELCGAPGDLAASVGRLAQAEEDRPAASR
jgi:phosphoglycolate phosphatase